MKAGVKISKSSQSGPSLVGDIPIDIKVKALESEVLHWKTRYELLLKYGSVQAPVVQKDSATERPNADTSKDEQ